MKRIRPTILVPLLLIAALMGILAWKIAPGPWKREHPLLHPTRVRSVAHGAISLADGRVIVPAGVQRRQEVTQEEYDAFLTAAATQGIEVIRETGPDSALLLSEPRFWNSCGTSNRRWPGSYIRWPLSELLIIAGYADPLPESESRLHPEEWNRLADAALYRELAMPNIGPWFANRDRILYSSIARIGVGLDEHFQWIREVEAEESESGG